MTGSSDRIRLAQIVYALCLGGSEVLAWRLAKSLKGSAQYDCSLFGIAHGGPLAPLLAADGIPSQAFARRGRVDFRLIARLAWRLRRDGIQVVHTHHLGQLLHGGLAAKLVGAKIVHTEHDSHSLQGSRTQRLFRVLACLTDRITTVADPVTAFLRDQIGIPAAKLQTIANGVLVEMFENAQPLPKGAFAWNDRDVVIGCVARLEAEKGHSVLLRAFHQLRRRFAQAKLLIVGDGSLKGALQGQARELGLDDAVQFLGPRSDVPAVLASCDLFVLPSLKEGVPLSILEAMAAGRAVVASRVGSIPQIVEEGKTGFLVPPDDVDALEKALAGLMSDATLRNNLGRNGWMIVRERYHFDRTIEAYRKLYEQSPSVIRPSVGRVASRSLGGI